MVIFQLKHLGMDRRNGETLAGFPFHLKMAQNKQITTLAFDAGQHKKQE